MNKKNNGKRATGMKEKNGPKLKWKMGIWQMSDGWE